jgi:hypothetical protein
MGEIWYGPTSFVNLSPTLYDKVDNHFCSKCLKYWYSNTFKHLTIHYLRHSHTYLEIICQSKHFARLSSIIQQYFHQKSLYVSCNSFHCFLSLVVCEETDRYLRCLCEYKVHNYIVIVHVRCVNQRGVYGKSIGNAPALKCYTWPPHDVKRT